MTFEDALRSSQGRLSDPDALCELARVALSEGEEERALAPLRRAATSSSIARLWQWKGLLERALDEHEQALASFEKAAHLDPADSSIAHGFARVALEAGIPSEHLFVHARRLAPNEGAVILGLGAARLAAGKGDQVEAELDAILRASPLWVEGHHQLAQLRSMLGKPELASASLDRALKQFPQEDALWQALFDLCVKGEAFAQLDAAVASARKAGVDPVMLRMYDAIAATELGETERADSLFASMDSGGVATLPIWLIRHLFRTGRVEETLPLIDGGLKGPRPADMWPYAAIAWRATGDERWDWLDAGGEFVRTVDLADKIPIGLLGDVLRSIHTARGEYLDQSVRGGTQTDGPLFSRLEPEIRALRAAVVEAVEDYVAQLPPPDPGHPLLGQRRDRRTRFAGSWSVRLKGEGFHVPHVHPQGWISSALYVAVPRETGVGRRDGWLQIGEPRRELGLGLEPTALIKPEPGRLVLFPSWMWHGTFPFPSGERLSVAFDIALPR